MNTIIMLNISTGRFKKFTNVEELIESYCKLPVSSKVSTFVLGLKEEALDYPGMMTFMLDYSNGRNELVQAIINMDVVEEI